MSLYSYKKDNQTKVIRLKPEDKYLEIAPEDKKFKKEPQVNIWDSTTKSYGVLQRIVDASSITNTIIPLILVLVGTGFILKQIIPDVRYKYEEVNEYFAQGTTSPVNEDYIDLLKYIATPDGLDIIAKEALDSGILQEDNLSKNYSGTFYLSIPSLGMDRLAVTANVNSTKEDSYLPILETSLAHFEGTSLPFSDVQNNTVIYGHSMAKSKS
ncbi:MAG: hypothetical protein Q9M91_00655 [Candidatus Dojkabacteria bacterium]|nr:hypothetical protein [Candidatus Dojkabacteria bacterium]